MKFRQILFIVILVGMVTNCNLSSERKALAIIKKSILAHESVDLWDSIESFTLQKETWLYFENGEVENHTIQDIEFRQKPFFEGRISWEKDSIGHKIVFDGAKTKYWMGDNEIQNEGFLINKKKDIDAAYYVLTKPFDLLDKSKHLKYQGLTKLADGREVETVQVIDGDPENPTVDIWWYFFDTESFQIVGYRVKTSDHFSMVYNQEWDNSTGILFPKKRESYRVDSLGNHLYLRAKYQFKNFSIN